MAQTVEGQSGPSDAPTSGAFSGNRTNDWHELDRTDPRSRLALNALVRHIDGVTGRAEELIGLTHALIADSSPDAAKWSPPEAA